jgi:hypothetical protein
MLDRLFDKTGQTGRHYQDFDTVGEARSWAERMRKIYAKQLEVEQSGLRVYLKSAAYAYNSPVAV